MNLQGGDNGCEWQMSLCNGELYDGWKSFAIDHSLKKGEDLVFTFVTNDCFVIHIFDEFGFEKKILRFIKQGTKATTSLYSIKARW